MNHREELGQILKETRERKGFTLRELSEATGIHFSNIAKIEKGKFNVGIDILNKVCKALEVEIKIE